MIENGQMSNTFYRQLQIVRDTQHNVHNSKLSTCTNVATGGERRIVINYRKTSSISRTKFQNSNVTCILLQLSSLNPLKPGVKFRMKM